MKISNVKFFLEKQNTYLIDYFLMNLMKRQCANKKN